MVSPSRGTYSSLTKDESSACARPALTQTHRIASARRREEREGTNRRPAPGWPSLPLSCFVPITAARKLAEKQERDREERGTDLQRVESKQVANLADHSEAELEPGVRLPRQRSLCWQAF